MDVFHIHTNFRPGPGWNRTDTCVYRRGIWVAWDPRRPPPPTSWPPPGWSWSDYYQTMARATREGRACSGNFPWETEFQKPIRGYAMDVDNIEYVTDAD